MLKRVLLANAASCLGFGILFLIFAPSIVALLGNPPNAVILGLGVGLILSGINIIRVAYKPAPTRSDILQCVAGDVLWVLGTIVLLASGLWITTPEGQVWSIAVAIWVATCAILQYRYIPSSLADKNPAA